jgi:hypothetical protein
MTPDGSAQEDRGLLESGRSNFCTLAQNVLIWLQEGEARQEENKEGFGGNNITFFGSISLILNNITGPGKHSLFLSPLFFFFFLLMLKRVVFSGFCLTVL